MIDCHGGRVQGHQGSPLQHGAAGASEPATADISLACNASYSHVGAVLQQRSSQGWQPLSFFNKKVDRLKRNILLWPESCWRHSRPWDTSILVAVSSPSVSHRVAGCSSVRRRKTQKMIRSSSLMVRLLQQESGSILCDVLRGVAWPLVPLLHKKSVFVALQNISARLGNK
jgi:hypothetical protein